jgi:type II secretory pathway pseudopilin PulG
LTPPPNPQTQAGITLIEAAVVIGLASFLLVQGAQVFNAVVNDLNARATGVRVAQYNSAVASWVNAAGAAVPVGVYNGLGWLQNAATCPGATGAVDYLPCGFDPFLPWNLQYATTVDTNATDPAVPPGRVRATTNLGTPTLGGAPLLNYGATLLHAARAYLGASQIQMAQNQLGITRYQIRPDPGGGANDQLLAVVDTAVNVDPWLRVDGTNQMLANLNVGGWDVNNARDVNASRDANAGRHVNAQEQVSARGGRVIVGDGAQPNDGTIALQDAGGNWFRIQTQNNQFQIRNGAWGAVTQVDQAGNLAQAGNLSAGQNVIANTAGGGGDVRIANTDNGAGLMSLAGALQGAEIVTTNATIDGENFYAVVTKPKCPAGLTPKIEAVAVRVSDNDVATPIGAFRTWAEDAGAQQWRVYASISTAQKQTEHSPVENQIAIKRYCQP